MLVERRRTRSSPAENGGEAASRAPLAGIARVWIIFFASGAAGLGYEIVWTRWFSIGLGHEMPSMLAVVAAFFGGISLGAWAFDARIAKSEKPSRWYAACEACIGIWGIGSILWAPYLNRWTPLWIGIDPSPLRHWLIAFFAPFLTLLPATTAMGASFPAYERLVARAQGTGRIVASLYAANTFGAILGVFLTTTWLIEHVGYAWTLGSLAALNLACAAGALLLRSPEGKAQEPEAVRFPDAPSARVLDRCVWFSGFLGIGYQVLCVAVLARATENTVYSFASALAVFLLGTAVGAALYQRYGERFTFISALRLALLILGLTTIGGTTALVDSRDLHDYLQGLHSGNIAGALWSELALAGLVMFLPATAMGFLFSHFLQTARGCDYGLGRALGLNTFGSALAPIGFGLLLLPGMGAKWALVAIAGAYFVWLRILAKPKVREYVLMGAGAFFSLLLPEDLLLLSPKERSQVVAQREGLMGAVSVQQTAADGERQLRINNRFIMGATGRGFAERRIGLMPLLLHGHPEDALFLGVGAGTTLGQAARYPKLRVSAAELVPDVVSVLPEFETSHRLAQASNVAIHVADARRFVRATNRLYDVVVADLFHPARDGAGLLYTLDHYEAIGSRLKPGGVFVQWLPLYQMGIESFRTIVRNFVEAFPYASAYLAYFNVDNPVIGLLGSRQPFAYHWDWLGDTLPKTPSLRGTLAELALDRDIDLFGSLMADAEALRQFAVGAARNTDAHPSLIFTAPRFLYDRTAKRYGVLRQLLQTWTPSTTVVARELGLEDGPTAERVALYARARDLYLLSRISAQEPQFPGEPLELLFKSVEQSREFRTAYVYAVQIAMDAHARDPATSRAILERLAALAPSDPSANEVLQKLFP
jgi:spermidine synthase